MLELKEKFSKENLKNGDIVTRKDKNKGIVDMRNGKITRLDDSTCFIFLSNYTEDLKNIYSDFDIIKVERPVEYKTIFERAEDGKEKIFDETEKEYLKVVIKPFKNRIKSIRKLQALESTDEHLVINLKNCDSMIFPDFEKGIMYKGMKLGKEYTLKELELDDEG